MIRWFKRRLAKNDSQTANTDTPRPTTAAAFDFPHDKIAARAAEIWERKGRPHGQDVQNWMEAEAELRAEFAANSAHEPLPRKSR